MKIRPKKQTAEPAPTVHDLFAEAIASGDINKYFAEAKVKAAEGGDAKAALEVLRSFVHAMDHQSERIWFTGPPYFAQMEYLSRCFERILNGEPPEKALNLGLKRGRPQGSSTHDENALGAMFWFLVRRGIPPEMAKGEICNQIGTNEKTVQRAAAATHNLQFPDQCSDDLLKAMFKRYASPMGAILKRLDI